MSVIYVGYGAMLMYIDYGVQSFALFCVEVPRIDVLLGPRRMVLSMHMRVPSNG